MQLSSSRRTWLAAALAGGVLLVGVRAAHAAATAEQKCQAARAKAAGKYADCAQNGIAKSYTCCDYNLPALKCVFKYAATWPKLQANATYVGTPCHYDRFDTSVSGTVIDRLTGLQWEQKTDDATVHDKDDVYTWTAGGGVTAADGTAFTTFLATLNGGGCFAGQCDWRLPTRDELLTIVTRAWPALTCSGPCIDPVFGPTVDGNYWSATTLAPDPLSARVVNSSVGLASYRRKWDGHHSVRAVRAGL